MGSSLVEKHGHSPGPVQSEQQMVFAMVMTDIRIARVVEHTRMQTMGMFPLVNYRDKEPMIENCFQ